MKEYSDFEIQRALNYVCSANSPLEALERFKGNIELLHRWRIMYAADESGGPFDLVRKQFSQKGFVSTMLRGKSVWFLDKSFAESETQVRYTLGGSIFLDSNTASFIRKLSYSERVSAYLDDIRTDIQQTFSVDELASLNPYIYLWEAQKKWSPETKQFCKETVAAVHALSLDEAPLSEGWGERFRKYYREPAEQFAEKLIGQFSQDLSAGLDNALAQHLAAVECMILRTKIIECSSSASPESKMEELINFMHHELQTFMLRELIVCADILFHTGKTKLSQKLNSVLDQKDPLHIINNCAWDLYIFRIIESMSNPQDLEGVDFCLDRLITFDEDIADVICLTELRAIAVDLDSHRALPFFNHELTEWLTSLIGHKRMARFSPRLQEGDFKNRANARNLESVHQILTEDRHRLMKLVRSR